MNDALWTLTISVASLAWIVGFLAGSYLGYQKGRIDASADTLAKSSRVMYRLAKEGAILKERGY